MTPEERTEDMLARYGECVSRAEAGRIIGRTPATIGAMIADGRLQDACAGTRVDVRSLAVYICAPRAVDAQARRRKRGVVCRFSV